VGNFNWDQVIEQAFQKLKQYMATSPVLAVPDFSQIFVVDCDASCKGLGVVLSQNKRLIAFFSKALPDLNMSKSVFEKELVTLI